MVVEFIAGASNTGAVTLDVNGLGVIPLLNEDGTALGANVIVASRWVKAYFNSTDFRLVSVVDTVKEILQKNKVGENYLLNSGTYSNLNENRSIYCNGSFDHSEMDRVLFVNGTTVSESGRFIHDNATNGGLRGSISAITQELLVAVGRPSGNLARYGREFFIAEYTCCTSLVNSNDYNIAIVTNSGSVLGANASNYMAFSSWIKVVAGEKIFFAVSLGVEVYINGVLLTATEVNPSGLPGTYKVYVGIGDFTHVSLVSPSSLTGYITSNHIYAKKNQIIHMAFPAITQGAIPIKPSEHTAPIPNVLSSRWDDIRRITNPITYLATPQAVMSTLSQSGVYNVTTAVNLASIGGVNYASKKALIWKIYVAQDTNGFGVGPAYTGFTGTDGTSLSVEVSAEEAYVASNIFTKPVSGSTESVYRSHGGTGGKLNHHVWLIGYID